MDRKTIIFDCGGVLVLPQTVQSREQMAVRCRLPIEVFERRYREHRLAYDKGTLTADEYWRRVSTLRGLSKQEVSRLVEEDYRSWSRINHETLIVVRRLADMRNCEGSPIKLALLSNMPAEMAVHFRREMGWFELFDLILFSCDLGMIKPEPEIYRYCLSRLDSNPGSALFIDDSQENVDGAVAVGIRGVLFRDFSPRVLMDKLSLRFT